MDDVTRRQAIKAAAAAGVVASGTVALGATAQDQQKGQARQQGENGQVEVFTSTEVEIACKNIVGSRACLYAILEGGNLFLEARYRGQRGRVPVANVEGEIDLFTAYGVRFFIQISNVQLDPQGRNFSARVRLRARAPIGGPITIIDETISINFFAEPPAFLAEETMPIVSYGEEGGENGGGGERNQQR